MSKYDFGVWYKKIKLAEISASKMSESNFYNNLKKIGYRYFSSSKKSPGNKKIIKSFQQHYLPNNVTGRIDEKTYKISHFLSN